MRLPFSAFTKTGTGKNQMDEDTSKQGNLAFEVLSKFGLPTAILVVGSYVIYSDIIKPIAGNYQELLLEVKLNNTEIRKELMVQAEDNRRRIGEIEKTILNNSEMMGAGIENIANKNKDELGRIELKIDQLIKAAN